MKQLLVLLAGLAVCVALVGYGVSHHPGRMVITQTPAEVIEQGHADVLPPPAPEAPEAPYVITPTDPKLAPVIPAPKPRVVQKKKPHHVAKPRPQQYVLPHCICKA